LAAIGFISCIDDMLPAKIRPHIGHTGHSA